MNRLTDKNWRNLEPWEICGQDGHCNRGCYEEGGCTNGCIVTTIYIELAKREDAEEEMKVKVDSIANGMCKNRIAEAQFENAELMKSLIDKINELEETVNKIIEKRKFD